MDTKGLMETAAPIVRRRARRFSLNEADTEDLLQDVMVKYLNAATAGAPDNPPAWLERVTERALIDRHRGRHPQRPMPDHGEPDVIPTLVAVWRDASATSLFAMKRPLMEEALGLLSRSDRELFERKDLRGEPSAEIAADLGIAVNTVDQRARRARKRLRAALEARPGLLTELAAPHPRVY